jgi:RNA polymerase sigma factor (TIGR02999 family)
MSAVTQVLAAIDQGNPAAAEQLLPLVYEELRKLAAIRLAQEKPGQTLQPTDLVHEAYLRLVGNNDGSAEKWDHRGHFFAAAAEAMRRILIDAARRKDRPKHGGDRQRINLDEISSLFQLPSKELLDLDEALTKLTAQEPKKAELVKLRFFAGLTTAQAANILGISVATAERYWTYARVWLYCELKESPDSRLA